MSKRKKFCKIISIFLIISITISLFPNRNVIANSDSFSYILDGYDNAIITGCNQESGTITIPSIIDGHDVTGIDEYAFEQKNFTNVIISEGITSIGDFAFMNCQQLVSIKLPNSLKKLDSHVFCNCSNLTTVTLPDSLESISYNVFLNCTKLEHINFPSSLKSIGSSAFQESGIKEVEIPASMISISSRAFFLCESLTSVKVYSPNVTYESQVYEGCAPNLKVYGYADSTTQTYANENGITFEELTGEPEAVPVESIELDKNNIRFLFTGDSYAENVNAIVTPENATDLTLNVTISNESVATISDITTTSSGVNFKVTPISDGTAVISVTSASDNSIVAYCGISVKDTAYPLVNSVALNKSTLELSKNLNEKLNVTVIVDDERFKDVIWTSSNDSVARVDNNGNVTAISAGIATITATSVSDDTKTAICVVTVTSSGETNILVESVTLNENMLELNVDDTETIIAKVAPNNATNKELNWTSGDTSVAIVDNTGKVTAVGAGNTTIMASSTDGSGKADICNVIVTERKVLVTSVELNKTAVNLTKDDTETLTATVTPNNATNKELNWTSSDTSVATVDNTGKVTAIGAGTAIITVTAQDGSEKLVTCTITVDEAPLDKVPNEIFVEMNEIDFYNNNVSQVVEEKIASIIGDTEYSFSFDWEKVREGTVTVNGESKKVKIVYLNSGDYNESDANYVNGLVEKTNFDLEYEYTVNENGEVINMPTTDLENVLGADDVEAVIMSAGPHENDTGFSYDIMWYFFKNNVYYGRVKGSETFTKKIVESDVKVERVSINKVTTIIELGKAETLAATVTPNNATNKELSWISNDTSVAIVDNAGKVTAVGVGNAIITVSSTDGSNKIDSCNVTVIAPEVLVTSVELNRTEVNLVEGDTETLAAAVTPNNATNKELSWISSDTSVAIVDNTGKVTAVGVGNAIITVSSTDGSNKIDSCNVTVTAPEVLATSVELNRTEVNLIKEKTETLIATVIPNNATNKDLSWISSNTSVATVDDTGKVTAVNEGTCTIEVSLKSNPKIKVQCQVIVSKYIKGDVDYDGVINGTDASMVLDKYNKNNTTKEDLLVCDMDGNGIINGTDASMILDIYNKVL